MLEMLYEKYSLDDIATIEVGDLADYLRDKGRNRFPDPENVARCIQKAARASYRLSKVVEDSIDLVLGPSIQAIRSIQTQLKDLQGSRRHPWRQVLTFGSRHRPSVCRRHSCGDR